MTAGARRPDLSPGRQWDSDVTVTRPDAGARRRPGCFQGIARDNHRQWPAYAPGSELVLPYGRTWIQVAVVCATVTDIMGWSRVWRHGILTTY